MDEPWLVRSVHKFIVVKTFERLLPIKMNNAIRQISTIDRSSTATKGEKPIIPLSL